MCEALESIDDQPSSGQAIGKGSMQGHRGGRLGEVLRRFEEACASLGRPGEVCGAMRRFGEA